MAKKQPAAPVDGELNPNHPITQQLRSEWHKVLALVMFKNGIKEEVINLEDLEGLIASGTAGVVVHDKADGMHVMLVDEKTALQLAAEHGGLKS